MGRAWDERAPSLQIVLTAVLAAVLYGVVHDQVTARVCVEYFTIGHPPVFRTSDPTLLGLGWGIIATWWVGLILGVPLAVVARWGSWPKTKPSALRRPIAVLLACMALSATVAGLAGYAAARADLVFLVGPLASRVPEARHDAFIADLWSHLASYGSGFVGGVVVIVFVGRRRRAAARQAASGEGVDG